MTFLRCRGLGAVGRFCFVWWWGEIGFFTAAGAVEGLFHCAFANVALYFAHKIGLTFIGIGWDLHRISPPNVLRIGNRHLHGKVSCNANQ